jgi:diaminohydroxyphosphoribosylaminopyrimidine deaminase/5-amino-6-(5-phosphoribosylamino)uracil reductase
MKSGVFHNIMAFIAPKLIGGSSRAPTPLGDLGLLAMHDAIPLSGVRLETCGRDVLMRGYAPNSQSTGRLGKMASGGYVHRGVDFHVGESSDDDERSDDGKLISVELAAASLIDDDDICLLDDLPSVKFFKAWDENGALSNFAPFPITIDGFEWLTVENYYQAQKFAGVDSAISRGAIEQIKLANSPEAAAKIGRSTQAKHPDSIRPDWEQAKIEVMRRALLEKFTRHEGPRNLLLQSVCNDGRARLIEDSPVDMIWGVGRDGTGKNLLGKLLTDIRDELLLENQ